MHDPLIMAFRVPVPRLWPRKRTSYTKGWARWRYDLFTVWHRDPSGHDTTTCGYRDLWKHPHHWRIQVHPWQGFRRRWLDRCAWCGKGSTKRDPVNISHSWDGPKLHWWQPHRYAFHRECSAIQHAHQTCTCENPLLEHRGYGRCFTCGRYYAYTSREHSGPKRETALLLQTIPQGGRDADLYAEVTRRWKAYRATDTGE